MSELRIDSTDKTQPQSLYREAVAFLESRINYETFLTIPYRILEKRLHHLHRLLDFLEEPDKNYPIIHVAGTKGKGSTCIFLEQILFHAGYRVGRFSSPHLHSLMERFSIDGTPCSKEQFCTVFANLKPRVLQWEQSDAEAVENHFRLTYFEWLTLLAFELFSEEKVDFAVFEVGLGGRFDSTNVCQPILSIISSISFDHLEQLGPTLRDIAAEKAGIIKQNIPVVSGVGELGTTSRDLWSWNIGNANSDTQHEEARDAIRTIAKERGAPCFEIGSDFGFRELEVLIPNSATTGRGSFQIFDFCAKIPNADQPKRYENLSLAAVGTHQIHNASLAIATVELIQQANGNISEEAIRNGLKSARLPARVEIMSHHPLWIVDGAHNRASIQALIAALKTLYQGSGKKYLIFASMLGKDNEGMISEIVQYFDGTIFTQCPNNPRAFPAQALYRIAELGIEDRELGMGNGEWGIEDTHPKKHIEVVVDVYEAIQKLQTLAEPNDLLCSSGSLYLAAIVRETII